MPDSSASPLAGLTRSELVFLQRALRRGQLRAPISEMGLQSVGKGRLYSRLGPLAGAPQDTALALLELALREASPPSTSRTRQAASLVWTGPDVHQTRARPTGVVLRELLARAQEKVLVAGYAFDHGAALFEPLHQAMARRGVRVSIYIDIPAAPGARARMDSYLALKGHGFIEKNWPFGPPLPQLYYWTEGAASGSRSSMHAKCVVVDGAHVLVGSANFTQRGHSRNVEVGVQLEDADLAAALTAQFDRLVERGDLAPLPVAPRAAIAGPPIALEDDEEDAGSADAARAVAEDYERLADELLVSDIARSLFVRLLAAGVETPEVGADVEGHGGTVIGSPELCWFERQIAVLLPEQGASRAPLTEAGWTCFSMSADGGLETGEFEALCELVGCGG